MTNWDEFAYNSPALAAAVKARLVANKHHIIGTLRSDGWPRLSGTEIIFFHDDLLIGSMVGAVKVADLLRDPRLSIHTNPGDEKMTGGDAKISGYGRLIEDPDLLRRIIAATGSPEPATFFRIDLVQIVLTEVDVMADVLKITMWTPNGGPTLWTRRTSDRCAVKLSG